MLSRRFVKQYWPVPDIAHLLAINDGRLLEWIEGVESRRHGPLPKKLVLYCGRHDYGTRLLQGTGNLAVVMCTMGHGRPSTAMKYQHPELEQVRRVLNGTNSNYNPEQGLNGTFYGTVTDGKLGK